MRFIRCARHRDEQNLYAFQYCGNIYYRAFRNIQIGQELIVWYDDKYQQHMGLPLNIQDMAIVDPNGKQHSKALQHSTKQGNSRQNFFYVCFLVAILLK